MMEHSIIKLDRPSPIVLYQGSLYLQVGSLFVITDMKEGINTSCRKCQIPVQNVYPVISDDGGQFGMKTCEQTMEDTLSLCREKEVVPFNKLTLWLTWNFIDTYGDPDLETVKNCPTIPMNYRLIEEVTKYGCKITKVDFHQHGFVIDLHLEKDNVGNYYFKTWEDSQFFFYAKYFDSVKKVAEYLLPGIEIYSKYIISKDFEWNFTIDDKDFQPLFNELNKYIKEQLSDGIDQWRKRGYEEIL